MRLFCYGFCPMEAPTFLTSVTIMIVSVPTFLDCTDTIIRRAELAHDRWSRLKWTAIRRVKDGPVPRVNLVPVLCSCYSEAATYRRVSQLS